MASEKHHPSKISNGDRKVILSSPFRSAPLKNKKNMAPVPIHADVFSVHSSVGDLPIKDSLSSATAAERVTIMQNELDRQMERSSSVPEQPPSTTNESAPQDGTPALKRQAPLQTLPREAEQFRRSANSARRRQWWNNVKINLFIAALIIAIVLLIVCKGIFAL